MIIVDYKSKSQFGKQEILIPLKLKNILSDYIRLFKIKVGESLLEYKYSNHRSKAVANIFKREINRNITVNSLRHSYITYMHEKGFNTLKERETFANKEMNHSTIEDLRYVRN